MLVRMVNTVTVLYINWQGCLRSRLMSQLARHLLLWSQMQCKSQRAVHILVIHILNRAANVLSRQLTFGYVRNPRSLIEGTETLCPHATILNHHWQPGTSSQLKVQCVTVKLLILLIIKYNKITIKFNNKNECFSITSRRAVMCELNLVKV